MVKIPYTNTRNNNNNTHNIIIIRLLVSFDDNNMEVKERKKKLFNCLFGTLLEQCNFFIFINFFIA